MDALDQLESHVMDRLAVQANLYPRTALLLAGRDGLERRGEFGKARATWKGENLQELLRNYLDWLEQRIALDPDD